MALQMLPPSGDPMMQQIFTDTVEFALSVSETTLAVIPALCLVVALPIVLLTCRRCVEVITPSALLSIKMIVVGTLACAEVSTVVSWRTLTPNELSSTMSIIICFGALSLVAITNYHHRFTLRSTGLLAAWYTLSIMCDVLRLWSVYRRPACHEVFVLTMFGVLLKATLVVLDELPKSFWIRDEALRSRVSPALTAGFWSRVFLVSFNYSMLLDFSGKADSKHLEKLLSEQSTEQLSQRFRQYWLQANKTSQYALFKTLYRTIAGPALQVLFPHILKSIFILAQPVLIHQVLLFMDNADMVEHSDVSLIVTGLVACIGLLVSKTVSRYMNCLVATVLRGVLISTICNKAFTLPYNVAQEAAATSLIDDDVPNIVDTINIFSEILCDLIEIAVTSFWLAHFASSAIFIVFFCMFTYYVIARLTGARRRQALNLTADASKLRVVKTSRVLSQMKAIRITGLNNVIIESLNAKIHTEIDKYTQYRYWLSFQISTITFLSSATWPVLLWGAMCIMPPLTELSASQVFSYVAVSIVFIDPCKDLLTIVSRSRMNNAGMSAQRIQRFLCLSENVSDTTPEPAWTTIAPMATKVAQSEDMQRRMNPSNTTTGNLAAKKHTDQVIPSITGKSPATKQLDYAIRLQNVSLGVQGKDVRILKNITLTIKRNELVMVAGVTGSGKSTFLRSLVNDKVLVAGSLVKIGGRTGYCDQKLWLRQATVRDNIVGNLPFDETWYNTVLSACLLRKDLARLSHGDQTHIGTNGVNLSTAQGSRVVLARALYLRAPYLVLDNVFAGLDYGSYCEIFVRLFGNGGILRKSPATVIMTTHSTTFLENADRVVFIHSNGTVSMHTDIHSAQFRDCWTTLSIMENTAENLATAPVAIPPLTDNSALNSNIHTRICETGDIGLLKLYIEPMSKTKLLLSVLCIISGAFVYSITEIDMLYWSEYYPKTYFPFLEYSTMLLLSVVFAVLMALTVQSWLILPSTMHFHQRLLDVLMKTKMSFLSQLSCGSILYLFTSDINSVMKLLPVSLLKTVYMCVTLAIYVVVIVTTNRYCLVLVPILTGYLFIAKVAYTRTSLYVRRVDSEAKEKLSNYVGESITGLRHIRAFGSEPDAAKSCSSLLEASQKPYYHMLCTERWLNLVGDMAIMTIQLTVAWFALRFKDTTLPASAGASLAVTVALVHCLAFTVQVLMDLQTSLGALARIIRFADTSPKEKTIEAATHETAVGVPTDSGPKRIKSQNAASASNPKIAKVIVPEVGKPSNENGKLSAGSETKEGNNKKKKKKKPLPSNWPSRGEVIFTNVTANYDSKSTAPPAVQDISINIPAGKKVGIIGRTGSGKTSLLMTLLNFLDYSGTITVDGYDISEIPYLTLRQKITTISQDIIDLGGTVQYNLCPWTTSVTDSDEGNVILDSLKIVLESLNMWDIIEKGGGVTAIVADLELSHGQMQLLTIARGMLHNLRTGSNVVIMDELTSHLDPRNEKIVKAALDKAFSDRTVISVVHREGLLKGADIVLRMEDGKIVETKHLTSNKTAGASSSATAARNKTPQASSAQASTSRRAEPPRPRVAQGPPRVIAPALQAMMDYMNNPNAPEPLDPNRHAIAELRMNFERRRMGLPPTTLPRQADDPSRPFSWSEQSDQPVQPQQAEQSQQHNQASRLGPSHRPDRMQQARQRRRPQ